MGFLKNYQSIYFFLYLIVKQFFPAKNQMTIFPDHISAGDPIFNKSQVYSTTKERFIYKLGYFTDDDTKYPNIFSKKYGIYYEPISCTGGEYPSTSKSTDFVTKENIIEKDD